MSKLGQKIKTGLKKIFSAKPKKLHWVSFACIFVSLTISYVSGLVSNDAKKENLANDIANIVKTNTEKSRYLGIIIQKAKEGASFSATDNEYEFRNVYGIFRQERATFTAGFNLDKKAKITIECFDSDENQSIMYVGQSTSIQYENGYKHNPYPFIFMFPLIRNESLTKNCLSISKTKALKMLANKFPEKKITDFTKIDYQKYVVGTKTNVVVAGFAEEYTIQNIYLEEDYYYDCVNETVGDFVIFSEYFYPRYSSGMNMNSQRMYFFNEYTYQNIYFIDYLNTAYSSNEFVFNVATNNFINRDIDLNSILSFRDYSKNSSSSVLSTIFLIISISLAFLTAALFIVSEIHKNKFSILISLLAIFLPYLIFKLIFLFSNSTLLFSNHGTKTAGIFIIVYLLAVLAIVTFGDLIKRKKPIEHVREIEI